MHEHCGELADTADDMTECGARQMDEEIEKENGDEVLYSPARPPTFLPFHPFRVAASAYAPANQKRGQAQMLLPRISCGSERYSLAGLTESLNWV